MSKNLATRWMDACSIVANARGPYILGGEDPWNGCDCSGLVTFVLNYCGYHSGVLPGNVTERETANQLMSKLFTLLTADDDFVLNLGNLFVAYGYPKGGPYTHIKLGFGADLAIEFNTKFSVGTNAGDQNAFNDELVAKASRKVNAYSEAGELYWLITKMVLATHEIDTFALTDVGLCICDWHIATPTTGLTGYTLAEANAGTLCPHVMFTHEPLSRMPSATLDSLLGTNDCDMSATWLENHKVTIMSHRLELEADPYWWTNNQFTQRGAAMIGKAAFGQSAIRGINLFDSTSAWLDKTIAPTQSLLNLLGAAGSRVSDAIFGSENICFTRLGYSYIYSYRL